VERTQELRSVEQFVACDEARPTYAPMRLLHLGVRIDRCCHVLVQKFDGLSTMFSDSVSRGGCMVGSLSFEKKDANSDAWVQGVAPDRTRRLASSDHSWPEIVNSRLGNYSDLPRVWLTGARCLSARNILRVD
jgi:hypothetical protein